MSKAKAIAVTAVSIGMVTVAGVAGFAVVNSANASTPTQTIALLADETPLTPAPNFVPGELPPIVTLEQSANRTPAQVQAEVAATVPQSSTSTTNTFAIPPQTKQTLATTTTHPTEITSLQARSAVLGEVQGTVTSISEVTRNGYEAFAVKVALTDGGTATGYVHKTSGVVFDWDVVGAPATTSGNTAKAPTSVGTSAKKEDDHNDDHKSPEIKSPEIKTPEVKAPEAKESSSSHDDDDD